MTSRHARRRPWTTVVFVAVLVAAEAALIGGLFGGWLLLIPGKMRPGLAAVFSLALLAAHIDAHRREYAATRLSRPLIAAQVLLYWMLVAGIAWIRTATGPRPDLAFWALPLIGGLALPVLLVSLAAIAPRPAMARDVIGTTTLGGIVVLASLIIGDLTRNFWYLTAGPTMDLVASLLTPLADGPVVRPNPFVIGTETFQVRVESSCSGFHGIGMITALIGGWIWWFRRRLRFPQSLLLVPLGAVLMWFMNALRITALLLVGIWISPEIAIDGFHSIAGWIAFLIVALGVISTASRSPFFTLPEPSPRTNAAAGGEAADANAPQGADARATTHDADPPISACIVPFVMLTAVAMLTRAFTSGFDVFYPLRVIGVGCVLWHLRDAFRWRTFRISPLAVAIGVVTFALWMLLAPAAAPSPAADPFQLGQPWAALWLMFRVAGSTVAVPVAEELFFRGFIARRCISEDADRVPVGQFTWFSFGMSSVLFGLLHGEAWLAGIVAGGLFAAALAARRRLDDAIVAHATTNLLLSGYVIATGSWSQWG